MWILESSGDFLQGRRLWLKPGQKYLFGRVKRDGVRFAIDHKTVSRKHFVIEVDKVKDGDVSKIHTRTRITISDQNSKSGTSVNGERIDGPLQELRDEENSVRPGTCPYELLVKWEPCVLTFNMMKKDIKSGILKVKQDRMQEHDIKVISEFVRNATTHVVVNKRNTPKSLQALINGKYIVADSFIDAIEYAATPADLDEEENLSPLEFDFDSAWPKPEDYLPAPAREPTLRPEESYQPNTQREKIFLDYVFVFGDPSQYDMLLPVITEGHGKALLYKIADGETTEEEIMQYMRKAAGKKGFGTLIDPSQHGGAIMVRWVPKNEHTSWAESLINQVALRLDQRAIDQAEFLDAILANDASLLRQSIPYESINDGKLAPPPSIASSFVTARQPSQTHAYLNPTLAPAQNLQSRPDDEEADADSSSVPSASSLNDMRSNGRQNGLRAQPAAVKSTEQTNKNQARSTTQSIRHRLPQVSRFKNFDDGFDADSVVPYEDDEDDEQDEEESTRKMIYPPRNGFQNPSLEKKQQSVAPKEEPIVELRKRKAISPAETDKCSENDMDDLMPAAAALKRRKMDIGTEAKRRGISISSLNKQLGNETTKSKPKKILKEIDVREVVRAQREAEQEAFRKEQERLEEGLSHDNEHKGPACLAVIEVMDLPVREQRPVRTNPEDDPRWDPKWNGRKNFKKFQPQSRSRETGSRISHSSKVIVPLVEVKRTTGGLGEKYWAKTPDDRQRDLSRRKNMSTTQRHASAQDQEETSQTINGTAPESESEVDQIENIADDDHSDDDDPPETNSETRKLQLETAEILHHEIDINAPRRTRTTDREQTQSQTQNSKKRPASATKAGSRSTAPGVNKKQKTIPVTTIHGSQSEEEDSDDLKFRFGSRSRRGKGK